MMREMLSKFPFKAGITREQWVIRDGHTSAQTHFDFSEDGNESTLWTAETNPDNLNSNMNNTDDE